MEVSSIVMLTVMEVNNRDYDDNDEFDDNDDDGGG